MSREISAQPCSLLEKSSDLESELETFLVKKAAEHLVRSPFSTPTVGVEQEFFVFKSDGRLSNLEDTQRFLIRLGEIPGWRVFAKNREGGCDWITRVSYEHEGGRYSTVKYEFPPHLLELALTYYDDLGSLKREAYGRWSELMEVAEACGLELKLAPFITPPKINLTDQRRIDTKYLSLAHSRRKFYELQGKGSDSKVMNFSSYMAATQCQVAIPGVWGDPVYMHRLYAIELSIAPVLQKTPELFKKRLEAYESVFSELTLVGFPKMSRWTLSEWVHAFCEAPLVRVDTGKWSTIREEWTRGAVQEHLSLLALIRDLQLIRPKVIGTVEFRADAAVSSVEEIIRNSAIRFAAALLASDFSSPVQYADWKFVDLREEWRSRVRSSVWSEQALLDARALCEQLKQILTSRGRGEEDCLSVF